MSEKDASLDPNCPICKGELEYKLYNPSDLLWDIYVCHKCKKWFKGSDIYPKKKKKNCSKNMKYNETNPTKESGE